MELTLAAVVWLGVAACAAPEVVVAELHHDVEDAVCAPGGTSCTGTVHWRVRLRNEGDRPMSANLSVELRDAEGRIVDTDTARAVVVPAGGDTEVDGSEFVRVEGSAWRLGSVEAVIDHVGPAS